MNRLVIILLCIGLSACASTQTKSTAQLEEEGVAVVLGVEAGFFSSVLVPIGTKVNLGVSAVDGKKLKWSAMEGERHSKVEVSSGKHVLSLVCWGRHDRMPFEFAITEYEITVIAGKTYQMQVSTRRNGCNVSHSEKEV